MPVGERYRARERFEEHVSACYWLPWLPDVDEATDDACWGAGPTFGSSLRRYCTFAVHEIHAWTRSLLLQMSNTAYLQNNILGPSRNNANVVQRAVQGVAKVVKRQHWRQNQQLVSHRGSDSHPLISASAQSISRNRSPSDLKPLLTIVPHDALTAHCATQT